jgi:hypothetical protein
MTTAAQAFVTSPLLMEKNQRQIREFEKAAAAEIANLNK